MSPGHRAGEAGTGQRVTTDDRALLHRVANTPNDLDVRTAIVSGSVERVLL